MREVPEIDPLRIADQIVMSDHLWPAVLIGIGGLVWGARAAAGGINYHEEEEDLSHRRH